MNETNIQIHPFIQYLQTLNARYDRGALAALRRGLGKPPGSEPAMYPYVVPWLPKNVSRQEEQRYFLIAALFAYHPANTNFGNMGDHLARTRGSEDDKALERRFTELLAAHEDDLPTYLRQTIGFLKSKDEIPVNWDQLFTDLRYWSYPERNVQRHWARAFWSRPEAHTEE